MRIQAPTFSLDNRLIDGGEVVNLTHWLTALYPQGRFLVLISIRGCVDPRAIVRLEGLGKLKNPMTSSGIKPGLVAEFKERDRENCIIRNLNIVRIIR
jgi:hypothetical protein